MKSFLRLSELHPDQHSESFNYVTQNFNYQFEYHFVLYTFATSVLVFIEISIIIVH